MDVRAYLSKARRSTPAALAGLLYGAIIFSLAGGPVFAAVAASPKKSPASEPSAPEWNKPLAPDLQIWHLLSRVTFGPKLADVEHVKQIGLDAYLDEQFHPERLDDSAVESKLASLPTLSMSTEELAEDFPPPNQAQRRLQDQRGEKQPASSNSGEMKRPPEAARAMDQGMAAQQGPRRITVELAREQLWRAVYSNRQLEEVMVQFWMNHFNIFAGKGADRWLLTSFERDAIRPYALGNFEDLLFATAKSPAMLFYLDNWMSVSPYTNQDGSVYRGMNRAPVWGRGFGRGLRSPFGPPVFYPRAGTSPRSPGKPGAGKNHRGLNENYARELMELHTLGVDGGYSQQDVREVARCFTGWTIDRPRQGGEFIFNARAHDTGQKRVLGHKIKKGKGMEDGIEVLHILAHHPSTAHFISLKLCRRFVADDPPESLVERASQTFLKSKGDIRAVLRTILTSPEFNSQAAFRAKVKSPFELVASSLRALGGDTDAGPPLLGAMVRMGQPLFYYQAPTGFPDRATAWINSGTLLQRMNFAVTLAGNRIRGTSVDFREVATAETPEGLMAQLSARLLGGEISPQTKVAILKSLGEPSQASLMPSAPPRADVAKLAALLMASPDFQRR